MNACTVDVIPENLSVAILIELLSLFYLPGYLCILLYHIGSYSLLPGCFSFQLLCFQLSFLFILSDSLLKFLLCLFFPLIHLAFLLQMFWILYLVNCLFLLHYLFFQEFYLAFILETSSVFLPCLTFSISTYLDETIVYCSLERLSFCRSVHSLHRP